MNNLINNSELAELMNDPIETPATNSFESNIRPAYTPMAKMPKAVKRTSPVEEKVEQSNDALTFLLNRVR